MLDEDVLQQEEKGFGESVGWLVANNHIKRLEP
jgi:hypothetical protein